MRNTTPTTQSLVTPESQRGVLPETTSRGFVYPYSSPLEHESSHTMPQTPFPQPRPPHKPEKPSKPSGESVAQHVGGTALAASAETVDCNDEREYAA